jgi:hypothetical protein
MIQFVPERIGSLLGLGCLTQTIVRKSLAFTYISFSSLSAKLGTTEIVNLKLGAGGVGFEGIGLGLE